MKHTYQVTVTVNVEYTVEAESEDLAEEEAMDRASSDFALTNGAYVAQAKAKAQT